MSRQKFHNTTPYYKCTCPSQNQVTVPSATHHPSDNTCKSPICSKLTGFNDGMRFSNQQNQEKMDDINRRAREKIEFLKDVIHLQDLELFDRMILIAEMTDAAEKQIVSIVPIAPNKSIGASANLSAFRFIREKPLPKLKKAAKKNNNLINIHPLLFFRNEILPQSYMAGNTYVSGISTSYGQEGF